MNKQIQSLSDTELIKVCKQGNQYAFEVFFNRYWKRLYTYTFKVLEDETACDDIVQEVFIKFWQQLQKLDFINIPEAYLFTSLKRTIANHLRKTNNQLQLDGLLDIVNTIADKDNLELDLKDAESIVTSVINELPEKCRNVFYLSRFEELSNKEIADRLGISIRTVESHISNALTYLKNHKEIAEMFTVVSLMLIKY